MSFSYKFRDLFLPHKNILEVDVVLLYDTFHTLGDPNGVLEELHRVLKPDGILSFSDHHMKENEIVSEVTSTYSFSKEG
ncbi:MAG: methyltransferase domain-containing protein [archaeon]|nr:methyltransferase domain-containing protein [archaeon]